MMESKTTAVQEMSDSEFLSFLYSERERENSLSQYQGWNNWALAGAFVTVLGLLYTGIRDAKECVDWIKAFYYAVGGLAFFLAYHKWFYLFKRERGVDYTRVRLLKERTPWLELVISLITSSVAIVVIALCDALSYVFWVWCLIFIIQVTVTVCSVCYRDKLVPFYFYNAHFPNRRMNAIYDMAMGVLLSFAWSCSFENASWRVINREFEIGIFCVAIVILIYLLVKVNFSDKVVSEFDAIVDSYIYTGVSKEMTYQRILCNRMGYGVLEVCEKDMQKVKEMTDMCGQKVKDLETLKDQIKPGEHDVDYLQVCLSEADAILKYLCDSLDQSDRLSSRLDEMVKIAPILNNVDIVTTIFDANKALCRRVGEAQNEAQIVCKLLTDEISKIYCRKYCTICYNVDCEERNELAERRVVRRVRWQRLFERMGMFRLKTICKKKNEWL